MKNKNTEINSLRMDSVHANPEQPRKDFDPEKLEELAGSIREYGVLEPIVVTPRGKGFMIIAGERRFRASQMAGLEEIPARVIEADDALVEELALLENVQRQDLNIIEEGRAYKALLDRGMTAKELAKKLGYKITYRIDIRVSLLNLTSDLQQRAVSGALTASQAYEISRLSTEKQAIAYRKIQSGELSTFNKLRAFVDGVIAMESQENIFELQSLSEDERKSIRDVEAMLRSAEKVLRAVHEENRLKHLSKAVFHSDVSVQRIDLIIAGLQKVRKSILSGVGTKQALEVA